MDEFSWAIGLFEGEGTIYRRGTSRVMALGMTDEGTVRRFAAAVEVGRIQGPYPYGTKGKAMWHWRLQSWRDIAPLLTRMYPHLSPRRQAQADRLLAEPPSKTRGPEGCKECPRGHTDKDAYGHCRTCAREEATRRRRRAGVAARASTKGRCRNGCQAPVHALGRCARCYHYFHRTGRDHEAQYSSVLTTSTL